MRKYIYHGCLQSLREIALSSNLSYMLIEYRLSMSEHEVGDDITESLDNPVCRRSYFSRYRFHGELLWPCEIAEIRGLPITTICSRIETGGYRQGNDVTECIDYPLFCMRAVRYRYRGCLIRVKQIADYVNRPPNIIRDWIQACGLKPGDDVTVCVDEGPTYEQGYGVSVDDEDVYGYRGSLLTVEQLVAITRLQRSQVRYRLTQHEIKPGDDVTEVVDNASTGWRYHAGPPSRRKSEYRYRGQLLTIAAIARVKQSPHATIRLLIERNALEPGEDVTVCLDTSGPAVDQGRYLYHGELLTVRQIARKKGIRPAKNRMNTATVRYRIKLMRRLEGEDVTGCVDNDSLPRCRRSHYIFRGRSMAVSEVANAAGLCAQTAIKYIKQAGLIYGEDVTACLDR